MDTVFFRFVTIHALTDGRTDRQTDRILIARPRLHSMQRGKNCLRWRLLTLKSVERTGDTTFIYPFARWLL